MFQLGSFEILRELSRSPHAILYAARRIGDDEDAEGQYAVKVFDAESVALLESVVSGQTFLERAVLQKKLAEHGTHHWAQVIEMGTPEEAYYVTELYPLTAQRIVNRQANIGVRGLYTIVWSVVRGLTELREAFRRAHGNLKLSNILIGDDRLLSPKTSRVELADPSVEAASARDRSADLLAIGELIHQLVLRRPFTPERSEDQPMATLQPPEWPVPMSAAWSRLGPDGKRWLDLCNWLLSPRAADRPSDLVELAVALHRLTPTAKRVRARTLVMAAIPVLLAGGALGWFWNAHSSIRADLQSAEQQWFGRFAKAMEDPARQKRFATADAALKDAADAMQQGRTQGLHYDVADDAVLQYGAYQNAKAAIGVVQRVEQDLTPEHSTRIAGMAALQKKYESRGWVQPVAFLGELVRATQPAPNADVAAAIDRLLEVSGRIGPDAATLEETWTKFDTDLQTAEKSNDRALQVFAGRLREMAASSLRLTDAGFDGLDAVNNRLPLAADLAKAAAPDRLAEMDRDRMAAEVDAHLNLASPSEADIRTWLAAADQYTRIGLDPAAEPVAGLSSSFRKLADDIGRQTLTEAELAQYQADRSKVETKLKELTGGKFVRKDVARNQGQIADLAADVQRGLDGLRKQWVRLDDPKLWVAFIDQPLTTASEELKLRWKGYVERQRLDVDALTKDAVHFKYVKEQAKLIREALAEMDKQFPPVTSGLGEALAVPAWDKREQMLKTLSNWAQTAPGAPIPVPPDLATLSQRMEAQGKVFNDWCASLRELANDFPIKKELLTLADRPDQAWAAKDKAFWNDPLVQNIVKKDVERIGALAAVAKLSRAELIAAMRDTKSAEIAVAAYRRLGEPATGQPAWPTTDAELAIELDVRNRTAKLLNDVRNETERKPASDEWYREGPIRWRRYTNLAVLSSPSEAPADIEKRLVTAIAYRTPMHPGTPVDPEKLDPAVRFNYALYEAKVAITDPTDAAVRRASADLSRAISGVKDRPEIGELNKRLSRLGQPEPMSIDPKLLAPQSPDSYTMTLRNGSALKFVRVESPHLRPFYLCTTELSLDAFIELINGGGNWGTANMLLGNTSTPGGAGPVTLRGPRAWVRPASNDGPIDRFDEWRFDTPEETSRKFRFSPELRLYRLNPASIKPEFGQNPKLEHPMQQLPAQAALYAAAVANCRLPTAREWQAAVELDRKSADTTPRLPPNLRDRTFKAHVDFSAKESAGQWPDGQLAGVFWPKSLKPSAAGPAAVVSADDHTVFFRVVADGGAGGLFHNLVGNVAEFTCEMPDEFDGLADRKSLENIKSFCQSYASQILVVGGSAFSSVELDPARPYPVNSVAEPYADVGVRLAFSAPARTIAERLKWSLQEQPYLAAAAVAKVP